MEVHSDVFTPPLQHCLSRTVPLPRAERAAALPQRRGLGGPEDTEPAAFRNGGTELGKPLTAVLLVRENSGTRCLSTLSPKRLWEKQPDRAACYTSLSPELRRQKDEP